MNRWTFPAIAVAGALVGAGVIYTIDHARSGGPDQARVENIVHDYVLAHPEIIPEAMQKLQDRESGKLVAALGPSVTTPYAGAWIGNPKGDVTLVEYFDYNCGFCRASLPMLTQLVQNDPKLRIVFRELPILSDESRVAARASLAAAQQGKFAAFHDALYAAGPVSDASIAAVARSTGVDTAKLVAAPADAEIATNLATARRLGMTGTPSWIIGDRILSGALPIEEFEKAIAAARAG